MGHVSQGGIKILGKKGFLDEDTVGELPFCEHCVLGMIDRVRFSTVKPPTKGVHDYVHSDLWGLVRVTSHGGNNYFITFLDDI